ncbi:MAG: hypothetical protein ABIZ56_10095 [Chthoniobacteraceae bacterium]
MNSITRLLTAAVMLAALPAFSAELQDSPPVDAAQILEMLTKLKLQQQAAMKQRRTSALDAVKVAAGSGEKAAALWKEAVKTVQFDGAEDEQARLRAWRDNEGDALGNKEVQNAARLHLTWLLYTLQFKSGVKKKDLLPYVIEYTNQLTADGQTMESFDDQAQKERERDASGKHGARKGGGDKNVKQMHDSILRTSVSASPVAKYFGLEDILPRASSETDRLAKSVAKMLGDGKAPVAPDQAWPMNPGDLEGIHQTIILPEYRAGRDPRILEYWDRILRREADTVAKRKVDYEEKRFATIRRPELLWSRAEDLYQVGLKNRAISEMVGVLKSNPLHPRIDAWISQLESLIASSADAPLAPPPAGK